MNIPNLSELMISVTDFKKQIADIMKNKKTKVIIRNNEPVSIILPYEEYQDMSGAIRATGEPFVLPNGVVMKVLAEVGKEQIAIKQYIQIKSTGEWKLHFTQYMGHPRPEEAMTNDEIMTSYELKRARKSPLNSNGFPMDVERIRRARKMLEVKINSYSRDPFQLAIADIEAGTPHMKTAYIGAVQKDETEFETLNEPYSEDTLTYRYITRVGLRPKFRKGLTKEQAEDCIYFLNLHLNEKTLEAVFNIV